MESDILNEIETFCEINGVNLLDGIVSYCESKGIEVETIGALVKKNPLFRDRLYLEAQDLRLVKKSANLINFMV